MHELEVQSRQIILAVSFPEKALLPLVKKKSSQFDEIIAVYGVGKYRETAEGVSSQFEGTPFRFVAMLDTVSPEPYNFTQDRLRSVLRRIVNSPLINVSVPVPS